MKFIFKWIKIKLKFSFTVKLAMFQMLSSYLWLMAVVLNNAGL